MTPPLPADEEGEEGREGEEGDIGASCSCLKSSFVVPSRRDPSRWLWFFLLSDQALQLSQLCTEKGEGGGS
jgi:hypothetical protein